VHREPGERVILQRLREQLRLQPDDVWWPEAERTPRNPRDARHPDDRASLLGVGLAESCYAVCP
jgi:hypothetical protein